MSDFFFKVQQTNFNGVVTVDTTSFQVTNESINNPPNVTPAMQASGRSVWWLARTRLSRGVYLNFSAFPTTLNGSLTSVVNDQACKEEWVLSDFQLTGWDSKPSTPTQSLSIWWLDDGTSSVPSNTIATIGSNNKTVAIHTMEGKVSPTSSTATTAVIRSIFLPYDTIAQMSSNPVVQVDFSIPNYGVASINFDQQAKIVIGKSFSSYSISPGLFDELESGWFLAVTSNFPTFSNNNEPTPDPNGPTLIDTTNLQIFGAIDKWIGRALFFDGPGYCITGSPTLKSVTIWWLEEISNPPTIPSISVVVKDVNTNQPLNHSVPVISSYTDLDSSGISNLIIRVIQIPYDQF